MSLSSVEGLLLAVLFILPGGVGDSAMRFWTNLPRISGTFRLLLTALGWSAGALALIEGFALFLGSEFGGYLLTAVTDVDTPAAISASLAGRYVGYFFVAALMPTGLRCLIRYVVDRFFAKTLLIPSLDALLKYGPQLSGGYRYAQVTTHDGLIEGHVLWTTEGELDDQAYIIEHNDGSVTWVPRSSMLTVRLMADEPKARLAD